MDKNEYIQRNRSDRRRSLSDKVEVLEEIDRLLAPDIQRSLSDKVEILEELDRLLEHEARWTKGCWARNLKGKPVKINSYEASSYCLLGGLGSLKKRYPHEIVVDTLDLLRHLANRMMANLGIDIKSDNILDPVHCVTRFNDAKQTEFVHIKRLISRALQQARKGSQGQMPKPLHDTKRALTKANPMKSVDKRDQRRKKERLSVGSVVSKPEPIVKPQQDEKHVARGTYSP